MLPIILVLLLAAYGNGQALDYDESSKCIWKVYNCYSDLYPIYSALQSFNLEPLSKGRLLVNICRKLPEARKCQKEFNCQDTPTSKQYLESSTALYNFVCEERKVIKMERQCWKNPEYKQGLKYCTAEFKRRSQNEVCTDMSQLKSCLSTKIEAIDDCTILADIFLDYLLDKIATHFIGNVC